MQIVFPCILQVVSYLSLSEISQYFIKFVKYVLSGSVFPQPISIKGSSGTELCFFGGGLTSSYSMCLINVGVLIL